MGLPGTSVWAIAVNPANPGVVYAGVFNGGVFVYSQDGPDIAAVPTMNEWGAFMFIFLAGIAAIHHIRRQEI